MKFIELTLSQTDATFFAGPEKTKITINTSDVKAVVREGDGTRITVGDNYLYVEESYEQVSTLLRTTTGEGDIFKRMSDILYCIPTNKKIEIKRSNDGGMDMAMVKVYPIDSPRKAWVINLYLDSIHMSDISMLIEAILD